MRRALALLIFLFSGVIVYAQNPSGDQNYVMVTTPKVPGKKTVADLNGLPIGQANRVIQYFDGLNRPLQTVIVGGSPNSKDLIQATQYDSFGRESKKYLPYADQNSSDGSYKQNALSSQAVFYNSPPVGVAQNQAPFSATIFEASSLNRVLEQGAPGAAWQPVSNSNTGHTIKMVYSTNSENEVKLWKVNGGDNGAIATVYQPAKLYKTISKDENWQPANGKAGTTEEFADLKGRMLLKRIWETDTKSLSTYYIYDDLGNLRYVLPPAVNENGQNIDVFDESQPVFANYIYGYHYDGRNRTTERKIPGKGWNFLVYNRLDQVVLSQDANQHQNGQWLFTKYDVFGRIIITGLYNDGTARADLQHSLDNLTLNGTPLWETRDNANSNGLGSGYSNVSFPTAIAYFHSIDYYDDYSFYNNTFGGPTGLQAPEERTKGLSTGNRITTLGTGNMLLSVNYYDDEGQPIQIKSENHLAGTDVTNNTYNFAGELTASTRTHTANGNTTTIANRFGYDHMGRKLESYENINSQGEVLLSRLTYNELGQVQSKKLHNGLQTTIYGYNERGWLSSSTSNEFSLQLKYDAGTNPQFNGNIADQNWGHGNNPGNNLFTYQYDKLNRLSSASAPNLSENISYDAMGNISSLTRDNYGTNNYTGYTGNKLTQISGFTNSSYSYDANGNLTNDSEKNISLGYNYLNQPIAVSGTKNITYTYNAAGQKLTKTGDQEKIEYVGGIQYKADGSIDFIQTEEGIARNNGNNHYSYEYNLSDHLGNVRASFYQNPNTGQIEVLQRDDYYAFGLRKVAQGGNNKYLYNGKELQEELGQYDYGARFYDPVVARWNVIDPMAENHLETNPYHYVLNNPVRYMDYMGLDTTRNGNNITKDDWHNYKEGEDDFDLSEVTITGNRRNGGSSWGSYDPFGGFGGFGGFGMMAIPPPPPVLSGRIGAFNPLDNRGANPGGDPTGLKDYVAIASGEAAGNRVAARAIGSVLLNRLDAAGSDLNDPNWMAASIRSKGLGGTVKGNYQILRHPNQYEYKMVMGMTIDKIRASSLPYIVGALQAYDNRATMDYSNGAISWSATPLTPQARAKDSNFQRVRSGIFTITIVAGNSTFFRFR